MTASLLITTGHTAQQHLPALSALQTEGQQSQRKEDWQQTECAADTDGTANFRRPVMKASTAWYGSTALLALYRGIRETSERRADACR